MSVTLRVLLVSLVSYGGATVRTPLLTHYVAAEKPNREEQDGQNDAAAGEFVLIHARLIK